jgi:cell pole-organizing protein PopZ
MKAVAVLKLPKPAKKVSVLARSIVSAMTTNQTSFPSPSPSLATVTADIAALEAADAVVLSRTKGARQERDVKLAIVQKELIRLKAYAQEIADQNPTDAEAIIETAGMSVKKPSIRDRALFEVVDGPVSGSVRLIVKSAGDRAAYEWQSSLDRSTWKREKVTLQASTLVSGLAAGITQYFRARAQTKGGEGAWSDVVSLVVR